MSLTQNFTVGTTSSTDDMRYDGDQEHALVVIQCDRCWDEYWIDVTAVWYDCDAGHRHFTFDATTPDMLMLGLWVERHQGRIVIRRREDAAPLSLWQSLC